MWLKVGTGGEYHSYYKHTKFPQNPRGDPKFLADLTRNDPQMSGKESTALYCCSSTAVKICC